MRIKPFNSYNEFEHYEESDTEAINAALRLVYKGEFAPRSRWRKIGDFIHGRNLSHSQHLARLGLAILFWCIVIPIVAILVMSL